MFHRINESMELGMHPAILYPRRNQGRPQSVVQQRTTIVRDRGSAQGAPHGGTLYALSAICPRTLKRALYKHAVRAG